MSSKGAKRCNFIKSYKALSIFRKNIPGTLHQIQSTRDGKKTGGLQGSGEAGGYALE
jgi:hypothetical protein